MVARLDSLWPAPPLCPCYNKLLYNLAYYKASLVKGVDVFVADAVLGLCLLYKIKLALDKDRILAQSSLPVVRSV